jgi:DNA-binding response OmpR family regulator
VHADRTNGSVEGAILFGPLGLLPAQRLLLQGDRAVDLGSRTLDILVALVERPSELVGKEELMSRVWPKIFFRPANLTVHIARLRRALGQALLHQYSRSRLRLLVAPVTFAKDHQTSNSSPPGAARSGSLRAALHRS